MFTDIHCHSSLKQYLFQDSIMNRHNLLLPDLLPFGMHADLYTLKEGGVNIVVCAHFLPEYGFREAEIAGLPARWLLDTIKYLKQHAEDRSEPNKPFEQTIEIMNGFENEIRIAIEKKFDTAIAKNLIELKQFVSQGKTVFLHSIEGAHSLGHGIDSTTLKKNIDTLYDMGLCLITLAHFFDNSIAPSQGGMPPSIKKELNIKGEPNPDAGLTDLGKEAVKYLFEKGIVVDITHCTPKARNDVFEINQDKRPIVISHSGILSVAKNGDMKNYPSDLLALPTDEEIKKIIATRGVVGVLFMNYWVNGNEEDDIFTTDNGIPDIIKTMKKLRELEKEVNPAYDCDHIAVGTDFDGFTQVPDDLVSAADMPKLINALRESDFSSEQIEKIAWKNFMRVLDLGWNK